MLKYLLEKEFKQFFRNKALPKMMIMMPLMAVLIFPLAADFEIKNINLSIVDHDKSPYSRLLIQHVQESKYFILTDVSETYTESLHSVESGQSDMILEIPQGFEKDLVKEQKTHVMIAANTVNGMKGGIGSSYMANIVRNFSSEVRAELFSETSRYNAPQFEVIPDYRFNPQLLYRVTMIPAIMIMILAMVAGFLPALNIVGEKEDGSIEQMNVTPVKKVYFILSKLIPYWILGFVVISISFLVAYIAYGLVPAGNLLVIYVYASLFVIAFSGFGLVISNYAQTIQQAIFMMFFFIITFIFLSGLYTPVENMPGWAQAISTFSPLKYMIQVLRLVYLKGSGFAELTTQLVALISFAVFFNGWAVLSYRKSS